MVAARLPTVVLVWAHLPQRVSPALNQGECGLHLSQSLFYTVLILLRTFNFETRDYSGNEAPGVTDEEPHCILKGLLQFSNSLRLTRRSALTLRVWGNGGRSATGSGCSWHGLKKRKFRSWCCNLGMQKNPCLLGTWLGQGTLGTNSSAIKMVVLYRSNIEDDIQNLNGGYLREHACDLWSNHPHQEVPKYPPSFIF